MLPVKQNLTQAESDLIWFSKGWRYYLNNKNFPVWLEANNMGEFWEVVRQHVEKDEDSLALLSQLTGKAIGSTQESEREFGEFMSYFSNGVRVRFGKLENTNNEYPITGKFACSMVKDLIIETHLVILSVWNVEEDFVLLPHSWEKPQGAKTYA